MNIYKFNKITNSLIETVELREKLFEINRCLKNIIHTIRYFTTEDEVLKKVKIICYYMATYYYL